MAGSGGSLGSRPASAPAEPAAMGSPKPGDRRAGSRSPGGGISRGDAFAQQGGLSGGLSGEADAAAGGLQQHIKIAPAPNLPEATRVALARLAGGADGGGAGNRVAGGGALGDHRVHGRRASSC